MPKLPNVAIDGLAASGKTSVARALSQRLGLVFVDTGLMYRAVTWEALRRQTPLEGLGQLARGLDLKLRPDPSQPGGCLVLLGGEDITRHLHTPAVSREVSKVAAVSAVRRELVRLQQLMAREGGLIMVGRDIATVVLPGADIKIFLTADLEERAQRRYLEMRVGNPDIGLQEVYADLEERDRIDTSREDSPLEQVPDALLVDTTGMTQEQVIELLQGKICPT